MAWLPDGEKTLRICVTVSTAYRRVTDGQTDILRRHSPRYAQHPAVIITPQLIPDRLSIYPAALHGLPVVTAIGPTASFKRQLKNCPLSSCLLSLVIFCFEFILNFVCKALVATFCVLLLIYCVSEK